MLELEPVEHDLADRRLEFALEQREALLDAGVGRRRRDVEQALTARRARLELERGGTSSRLRRKAPIGAYAAAVKTENGYGVPVPATGLVIGLAIAKSES